MIFWSPRLILDHSLSDCNWKTCLILRFKFWKILQKCPTFDAGLEEHDGFNILYMLTSLVY